MRDQKLRVRKSDATVNWESANLGPPNQRTTGPDWDEEREGNDKPSGDQADEEAKILPGWLWSFQVGGDFGLWLTPLRRADGYAGEGATVRYCRGPVCNERAGSDRKDSGGETGPS
jgi:hypothetical protein